MACSVAVFGGGSNKEYALHVLYRLNGNIKVIQMNNASKYHKRTLSVLVVHLKAQKASGSFITNICCSSKHKQPCDLSLPN